MENVVNKNKTELFIYLDFYFLSFWDLKQRLHLTWSLGKIYSTYLDVTKHKIHKQFIK